MNIQQTDKNLKTLRKKCTERLYEFKTSEDLTRCILQLYKYKKYRYTESSLYKTENSYCLIINATKNCKSNILIKEFCQKSTASPLIIGKTEEYEIELIKNNAISVFGKAFNRET